MSEEHIQGEENQDQKKLAERTVRRHMYGAFSFGLIPIPFLDIAALTGVQVNLIRKLTSIYDVPFSKNAVKNIVGSLLAGVAGPSLASLVKAIPILGFPLGIVSVPFIAAAATYAVGQIFIRHFESDGTLLTFDTEKAKTHFVDLFSSGLEKAKEMKNGIGKRGSVEDDLPLDADAVQGTAKTKDAETEPTAEA